MRGGGFVGRGAAVSYVEGCREGVRVCMFMYVSVLASAHALYVGIDVQNVLCI